MLIWVDCVSWYLWLWLGTKKIETPCEKVSVNETQWKMKDTEYYKFDLATGK